jgi:E3 ubiquitin-protein ligase DOA10
MPYTTFDNNSVLLNHFNVIRFIVMVGLGIMIIWLFQDSYKRTGKISQQLYDQILEHALESEQAERQRENAT